MTRPVVARRTTSLLIAVVLLAVGAASAGSSPASAHSTLLAASPGPGAVVGGTITTIALRYENEVVEFTGRLTGPDGADLESSFEIVSPTRVTITLAAALSEPGEYAVRHGTRAQDTDLVEAAFLFTFDPDAPPPVFLDIPSDDGRPWFVWAIGAVGAAIIAVLMWRLLDSIRHRQTPPN